MAEAGETLSLPLGGLVTLRLPEIGGTAFLWHLRPSKGFDLLSDKVVSDIGAPGSETVREYCLRSIEQGQFNLQLFRYRPWETENDADAKYNISILVGRSGG